MVSLFVQHQEVPDILNQLEYMHSLLDQYDCLYQWVVIDPRNKNTFTQADRMLDSKKVLGLKIMPGMHGYDIKEYGDSIVVYKVDTDKEKELSMAMGIQSLPTIVFIPKTGQPQIIVGAADKSTFRRAIDEVLLNKK